MRTMTEQRKVDRRTVWQYVVFSVTFTVAFILNIAVAVFFGQVCAVTVMVFGASLEMINAVAVLGCIVAVPGVFFAWYYSQDFIFEQF